MSQSTFTISSTSYNMDIFTYDEDWSPILTEKATIIDPDDYDAGNSVLVGNGYKKHNFTITGACTLAQRLIFLAALKNNTKVYPVIYPGNGTTNIIETKRASIFSKME